MFVGHDGRLTSDHGLDLPAKTKAPVERTLTVAKLSPAEVTEVTEEMKKFFTAAEEWYAFRFSSLI